MDPRSKQTHTNAYRRSGGRVELRIHAQIATRTKTHPAILVGISRRGAGFVLDHPLQAGETALVKWNGNEVLGTIQWASGRNCGIAFDRAVSEETLRAALALHDASPAPADDQLDCEAAQAWVAGSRRFGFN